MDRQSIRNVLILILAALVSMYDELHAPRTLRTGSAVIRPKDPLDELSF